MNRAGAADDDTEPFGRERARHQPRHRPARRLSCDRRAPRPATTALRCPLADKGYDSDAFRRACRERGTEPVIPKRKTTGVKGLGKLRYVVEQTFALLHQFRRLAVRWERRLDIHDGFVSLACVLICWRRLINWTAKRSC